LLLSSKFHTSQLVASLFDNAFLIKQIEKVAEMDDFKIFRRSSIRSPRSVANNALETYRPLLATWLIEMTLSMGWYKKRKHREDYVFEEKSFAQITGFAIETDSEAEIGDTICIDGEVVKHTDKACARILKSRLDNFRKQAISDERSLLKNICTIGRVLGLSNAEMSILCFAATLELFPPFHAVISSVSTGVSLHYLGSIIALISGQKNADVMAGLRESSTLVSSGIIKIETGYALEDKLSLLNGLDQILFQPHKSEEALLEKFLKKAGASSLTLHDFPHLAQDTRAIVDYLKGVLRSRASGTNILFYGVPGTGKTEYIKALAVVLGVDLYEISFANEEGNPISGTDRLRAYNLCQRVLRRSNRAILMFDEVEDVFPSESMGMALFGLEDAGGQEKSGKAWINRTLERNETPAIWVTNDANIDPAYLRRFDYSVRFSVPPQQVRMSIARHHLGQFKPTEAWLARIAASEQMSPAQYERAAKVASLASCGDKAQDRLLVEQTLDRSAGLLGQKRLPSRNALHTAYDLRFINTSLSVEKIIAGLNKKPRGTFCFYGPAGTGKSEFARHIADKTGKSIIVKRASDILSKWVGEAEQNIAEMFAEARQQEAILVLDEADSFLADRRDAHNSWEVTQVNELLTQMEAFEGIFVCTTNLLDKLDQASLRRFAFKVKFDFLTPVQRWEMFQNELIRLGGDLKAAGDWESRVRSLEKLTPGDFAVAARQFDVLDLEATPAELFQQLQEECKVKGGSSAKIGFVQ
jgi:SpoVK/Ycf46/Vps4 family AAA+-type ATPase